MRPPGEVAVRSYEDSALLERAWARLDAGGIATLAQRTRRRRSRVQLLAAVSLFCLGIAVGRWTVGGTSSNSPSATVSAESSLARTSHALSATGEPDLTPALAADGRQLRPASEAVRKNRERGPRRTATRAAAVLPQDSPPGPELSPTILEDGAVGTDEAPLGEPASPEPVSRAMWLVLAERGDFAAAFSELDHDGTFQAVLKASSAEELMTLADVARFAGREGRAILALRTVTERYRHDPNAPLAAMMLGNLLSRAGDRAGAAAAYALNRSLSPEGDFAEDALVRELDLALAERDLERVAELFQKYEAEFASESSVAGDSRLATLRAKAEALRAEQAARPSQEPDAQAPESTEHARGSASSGDDERTNADIDAPPGELSVSSAEESP